jgi:N-methylhydantoinase A/oxoprolinase/acetone carboxylase beta subunit
MVEAVAMRTTGLGGDSEVHFLTEGLHGGVTLGPKRVLPIALIAAEAPEVVHAALDAQLRSTTPGEYDGRFVRAVAGQPRDGISAREQMLLDRIGDGLHPMADILRARIETGALKRLVERGLVQLAGVTPSDASHVLGRVAAWDAEAAGKALRLFGRRRTGAGQMLAPDPAAMAQIIVDQLTEQTALAMLEAALAEEEPAFDTEPETLARHELLQRGLRGHAGLVRIERAGDRAGGLCRGLLSGGGGTAWHADDPARTRRSSQCHWCGRGPGDHAGKRHGDLARRGAVQGVSGRRAKGFQ